jgi:alpha-1,2-mannosyltransferase
VTAPTRPPRRITEPRVAAVLIGVVIATAALAWTVWHQLTTVPELRLVDLDVYRSAGHSLITGRPVYSYLTPPPQLLPFTYPPFAAVLAIPLAFLPWLAAQWVWTLGQVAVLAVITAVSFRPVRARLGDAWPIGLGVLVAAAGWLLPIRDGIRFGQVDVFLVALCLLDCVVRHPKWPRGMLIGVATAVKLTPAVFIPYLWMTGRRRAAYVAAGSTLMFTAVAAFVSPMATRDYFGSALFDSARLGSNDSTSNQSLRGMLLRTPLSDTARAAVLVVCLIVVAVVGYRRARMLSLAGDEVAGVAVVGLLAVLLSPVAWIHHLAWIVLVMGVVAGDFRSRIRTLSWAAVGAFYGFPLPWIGAHLLKTHHPLVLAVPLRNAYGLGAVLLVAVLRPRGAAATERDVVGQHGTSATPFGRLFVRRSAAPP